MHGFQHSRGRVFFDAVCALAVSASFAGAWIQTGASALLAGAGVALLYGVVRLFDMRRVEKQQQRTEFPAETAEDVAPAIEPLPAKVISVEPSAAFASDDAPAKPARKSKAKTPKKPKLVEVQIADPAEPAVTAFHEANHAPLTPLFEPVPVVREMRTFGRKAG